ncbi:MAG TPA: hypothetical protein VN829_09790 [Dongiaceae bacterium]|nr:hypothetical protein [Dongiaceae bacterium]
MDSDLEDQTVLVHQSLDWTDVLREAERLGAAHNERLGCRSADLFHVAAACQLGCAQFLTFDQRQAAMAEAAGLTLKP